MDLQIHKNASTGLQIQTCHVENLSLNSHKLKLVYLTKYVTKLR